MAKLVDKMRKAQEAQANMSKQARRRTVKRQELVGMEGRIKQDSRNNWAIAMAALDPNDTVAKARGREVQQRMKEYKGAKIIDRVKRYKNPENK